MVAGLTAYLGGVERRLREAELAQARAEARAAGERRRRLLTLALAASVLATALIGAAGWAWMDRERQRRERSIRAGVDAALSEASKKRDRARDAGGADPVPWVEAIEAARRAESLLGGGDRGRRAARSGAGRSWPSWSASATRPRPSRRIAGWSSGSPPSTTISGVHNDDAKADAEYAAAFRAYGVDLDRMEPAAAGRVLAASPAAADLANALDHWAFLRRGPTLAGPGRRDRGWSRPPGRPIPTRGGTGSGTRSAGWGATRPAGWKTWNGSPPRPTSTICRWRASPGWPPRSRSSAGARHGDRAPAAGPGVASR